MSKTDSRVTKQTTEDNKASAINAVFVLLLVGAILFAAFRGRMGAVTDASFESAKGAVNLAINLVGIMALWLGLVRVLEAGGLMYSLARLVKPLMVKLFPDVPSEHPAMSSMLLNISANMLGLGNAATPLGIKAMVELNKLNPFPGTATNAMCLFLAINTSSVTILPLGVIGVRAAAGAMEPANIFLPTLIATIVSTIVGVSIALFLAVRDRTYLASAKDALSEESPNETAFDTAELDGDSGDSCEIESEQSLNDNSNSSFAHLLVPVSLRHRLLGISFIFLFVGAFFYQLVITVDVVDFLVRELVTFWLMPLLMLLILTYGVMRGVKVYEAVTEGAKQGFDIAIRIIPFLVAILVAIGMFRASGAMELIAIYLDPITRLIGMPADVLPMALVRPLSGGGAFGVMSSLVETSPDSYSAYLASTMQGSTETTFYVLAVYFGAVGVTRIRHALVAAILADVAGIFASCLACSFLWAG